MEVAAQLGGRRHRGPGHPAGHAAPAWPSARARRSPRWPARTCRWCRTPRRRSTRSSPPPPPWGTDRAKATAPPTSRGVAGPARVGTAAGPRTPREVGWARWRHAGDEALRRADGSRAAPDAVCVHGAALRAGGHGPELGSGDGSGHGLVDRDTSRYPRLAAGPSRPGARDRGLRRPGERDARRAGAAVRVHHCPALHGDRVPHRRLPGLGRPVRVDLAAASGLAAAGGGGAGADPHRGRAVDSRPRPSTPRGGRRATTSCAWTPTPAPSSTSR